MPTIQMVAKKSDSFHYGGERRFTGDIFNVRGQSDAQLLRALGWAADAPPEPAPVVAVAVEPRQTYRTRAIMAEAPPAPVAPVVEPPAEAVGDTPAKQPAETSAATEPAEQPDDEPKPKRAYRRRDMRAES